MWAHRLHHPYRLWGPQRFRVGHKKRGVPHVGGLAISPLPSRGSLTLLSGAQNGKGSTFEQFRCITLAVSPVPTLQSWGQNQKWPHMWVDWRYRICLVGGPDCFKPDNKIQKHQHVVTLATSHLPSRVSPTLRSGEKIINGPHMGGWANPHPPLVQTRPRSEKQRSHGVSVLRQARACARHATQRDTAHRKPAHTPHQAHHKHGTRTQRVGKIQHGPHVLAAHQRVRNRNPFFFFLLRLASSS